MKHKSLLEIAKSTPSNIRSIGTNEEEMAVALAWARDEITYKQACTALIGHHRNMNGYCRLARGLRQYIRNSK